MKNYNLPLTLLIVSMVTCIFGDYDCVCNYAVEKPVYPEADVTTQPIGYLYEFDCKPETNKKDDKIGEDYIGIQYEKQVGYITASQDVQIQICPGDPPDTDLIPTTLKTTSTTIPTITSTSSTTNPISTTISSTTKPTTIPTTTHTTTTTTSATTPTTTTTTSTTTPTTTTTTSTTTPTTTTSTTTPTTTTTSTTTPTTRPTTTKSTTTTTRPTTPVPVTWPIGTYGLMQTAQGCPAGNTRWVTGWRKQDTEDDGAHNYFTTNIQNVLGGQFMSNNLVTKFCIKDASSTSLYDKPWPSGSYCILKHKACPSGFGSGFIHWDDEDSSNSNGRGGALPDGNYDGNTQIYYCCRGDGSSGSEISLPTERPFILVRFGNTCQSVRDMTVSDVFVRWDDEDTLNSSGKGGWHPFDEGGSKDHLLHFCYYHSKTGPALVG